MLPPIWKRIAATLLALACLAALSPAAAQACSCVPRTADTVATWLSEGKPAVIGEVTATRLVSEPPASPDPSVRPSPMTSSTYAYTVRVERGFNGEFGAEATIVAGSNGAMCGITWKVGDRISTFLSREGGEWGSSLCRTVDPAQLIAAAEPPPPPPPPPPIQPPVTPPAPPTPPTGAEAETPAPLPTLQARLGKRVAAGGSRAGTALERLPARATQVVRLRLDAPARSVRFALARADGKRLGRLRHASAVAGARRLAWNARLPRVLPARADRLLVAVAYGAGKRATFAVGLGQPSQASAAGLPCPFPAV